MSGGASAQRTTADEHFRDTTAPLLRELCVDCHGNQQSEAKVNLEQFALEPDFATDFKLWRKVVEKLEQREMPPKDALQPSDIDRQQLISVLRQQLRQAAEQHANDPGSVMLRRLTSAEYAYSIRDLTGLDLNIERDFVGDAVGGEGFANVGTVQFMQDSTLERYLDAAKQVAAHAVIGVGPLDFYQTPGQTGLELSAIARIQNIYRAHGFRTASGEGGEAFGLDRYSRAFYTAWRYRYRNELGLSQKTLADLAAEEDIDTRFAQYIWSVLNRRSTSFPTSDVVNRWDALPVPDVPANDLAPVEELAKSVRLQCDEIHQVMYDWQTRFGQNADAKEEAPVLAVDSFVVDRSKRLEMNINWPPGTKAAHIQLKVESANDDGHPNAVVVWRDPAIQFRIPDRRLPDPKPLRTLVAETDVARIGFGKHPGGSTIEPHDFVTTGTQSTSFELPVPDGATSARLTVTAELDVQHGDDCIVRCTIAQEEETDQGKQVSALLANSEGTAFGQWRAGVLEFARLLPQVSHREPAPSDRDPIPAPFDNSYNNPERNHYHYKIKYHRDDNFLVDNILDDVTRRELDQAWMDLLGSFEYHNAFLRFVATKYQLDLGERGIADLDADWVNGLAEEPLAYVQELIHSHRKIAAAFETAVPVHLENALQFASRAWRRPLTDDEQQRLREYYASLRKQQNLDHRHAMQALLTRVLVAPEFLYRAERPRMVEDSGANQSNAVALSDWELASRLSYFLWSSLPDEELRHVAASGELNRPEQLTAQITRMLRDPKARRLATEFFGQWFGFYQFDRYRGIDPERFPEFTDSLRGAMYDEAIAFFEHIIRADRPVREILFADYCLLNGELAAHYGIEAPVASTEPMLVTDVLRHHRGGLLGLGAVLAVTSAPQRTSPVKRGDWVLRRVLGIPVPPPPADAGSIAAGDVVDDGLTIRTRLEQHRRDASCKNCHSRIDPLGFALEQYDAIGRWRENYRDGQTIESVGELNDGSVITGIDGLREYLRQNERLFQRTLCTKLVGYAFGRGESIEDVLLIEQMLDDVDDTRRLSTLVEKVVHSRQFLYQRSGGKEPPEPRKQNE
ncbi:MAG: DUF1592 domain-containing protein [Planctomycetaceae bacterium]|nr:DUF1592 domain-containing protein [Planctomycetales bacterium]MCB9922161.1 DUF1592 domain-containing protein [Planctomycetaceae bacterium]